MSTRGVRRLTAYSPSPCLNAECPSVSICWLRLRSTLLWLLAAAACRCMYQERPRPRPVAALNAHSSFLGPLRQTAASVRWTRVSSPPAPRGTEPRCAGLPSRVQRQAQRVRLAWDACLISCQLRGSSAAPCRRCPPPAADRDCASHAPRGCQPGGLRPVHVRGPLCTRVHGLAGWQMRAARERARANGGFAAAAAAVAAARARLALTLQLPGEHVHPATRLLPAVPLSILFRYSYPYSGARSRAGRRAGCPKCVQRLGRDALKPALGSTPSTGRSDQPDPPLCSARRMPGRWRRLWVLRTGHPHMGRHERIR